MSFADQLRKMPEAQAERDMEKMINKWHNSIKRECEGKARQGDHSLNSSFQSFCNSNESYGLIASPDSEDEKRLRERIMTIPRPNGRKEFLLTSDNADEISRRIEAALKKDGLNVKAEKRGITKKYREEYVTYQRSKKERFWNGVNNLVAGYEAFDTDSEGTRRKLVEDGKLYDVRVEVSW